MRLIAINRIDSTMFYLFICAVIFMLSLSHFFSIFLPVSIHPLGLLVKQNTE